MMCIFMLKILLTSGEKDYANFHNRLAIAQIDFQFLITSLTTNSIFTAQINIIVVRFGFHFKYILFVSSR